MRHSTAAPIADDASLQARLQALAQEAVSVVMEADPAHGKELLGLFVADLFSQVAEQERKVERHQRQAEGIAAAKERGVRFGRARIPMPEQFEELAADWWYGRVTAVQAGKELGISRTTFKVRALEWCRAKGMEDHLRPDGAFPPPSGQGLCL